MVKKITNFIQTARVYLSDIHEEMFGKTMYVFQYKKKYVLT